MGSGSGITLLCDFIVAQAKAERSKNDARKARPVLSPALASSSLFRLPLTIFFISALLEKSCESKPLPQFMCLMSSGGCCEHRSAGQSHCVTVQGSRVQHSNEPHKTALTFCLSRSGDRGADVECTAQVVCFVS